jgi:O-antigen ligase
MQNNILLNKQNIAKTFFLLFLASLFFPVRHVFLSPISYQTGAYSDFTSISLYLSDIFLFFTVIFTFLPRGGKKWSVDSGQWIVGLLILWLMTDLIWHIRTLSSLNCWFFFKYLELFVAYETSRELFRNIDIKDLFIRVFVVLSSIESLLGIIQFLKQKSVGSLLHRLGEGVLSPQIKGLAKIVSGGTSYIRGYGTFPHPNVLSAFLLVGILFSVYLLLNSATVKQKATYAILLFVNIVGLTVTFSRASFLAIVLGLILFFTCIMMSDTLKGQRRIAIRVILIILASVALCIFVFKPYLETRATVSDGASLERVFYAKIGLKMVADHPVFGVGIGESMLHMQQYSPFKLLPWQIQPIHNYFLLAAAEIGIPGALILLWFFMYHLYLLIKKTKSSDGFSTYYLLLTTILVTFLILMQFDHYFYTLQQTQMLLWVILGIIAAGIKKSPLGDNKQTSENKFVITRSTSDAAIIKH